MTGSEERADIMDRHTTRMAEIDAEYKAKVEVLNKRFYNQVQWLVACWVTAVSGIFLWSYFR